MPKGGPGPGYYAEDKGNNSESKTDLIVSSPFGSKTPAQANFKSNTSRFYNGDSKNPNVRIIKQAKSNQSADLGIYNITDTNWNKKQSRA